ncbi:MAG: hypothetical protein HY905_04935 [Deltaproteobacteria bacterium]|nr:hypothetical protein [Deltaproteobacteria bacterium]
MLATVSLMAGLAGGAAAQTAAVEPAAVGPVLGVESVEDVSALHARAETLQAACDSGDVDACDDLPATWDQLIAGYRFVLAEDPMGPHAYDCMFNLATALYFAGWEDEALEEYRAVEDSPLGSAHERDALANQITILGNWFAREGQSLIPEEPPTHVEVVEDGTERTIADPVPLPPLIARWHAAMLRWVERYPEDPESLGYRHSIAGQLFFLGHWDEAERMYQAIFDDYCGDPTQETTALEAWQFLRTLAALSGDRERIQTLRDEAGVDGCFPAVTADRLFPRRRHPCGGESELIVSAQLHEYFAAAWDLYEAARDADDPEGYGEAARILLEIASNCPDARDSPAAIRVAAVAFGQAHEPVLAGETWKKLIEFCSPPSTHLAACEADGPGDPNRVRLAEAHFFVASYAMQTFDLEQAARSFCELEQAVGRRARGEVLRPVAECIGLAVNSCTDGEYIAESVRAQAAIARLRADWAEAARVTKRILDEGFTRSVEDAARMKMDVVEFYRRASAWSDMRRAAKDFLDEYEGDADRRLDVLRVRWFLHQDAEREGDARAQTRALRRLQGAYENLTDAEKGVAGADLGPAELQLVLDVEDALAKPASEALESDFDELARLQFRRRSVPTFGDDLMEFKDELVRRAKDLTAGCLRIVRDYPVAPTGGTAARFRIAFVWYLVVRNLSTLSERLPAEWLDTAVGEGTLRDRLEEIDEGVRQVVVEDSVTIETMVRNYLLGDGTAASGGVVGATAFARAVGASNEWVRRAVALAVRLGLSDDPGLLFVRGPMPAVSGPVFPGGLDPVAE